MVRAQGQFHLALSRGAAGVTAGPVSRGGSRALQVTLAVRHQWLCNARCRHTEDCLVQRSKAVLSQPYGLAREVNSW